MSNKLQIYNCGILQAREANKICMYNTHTQAYGLTLTQQQATELVEVRNYELCHIGRIEFGEGIIGKLIVAFCDSPYISQDNYSNTIQAFIEIFYYYKNETLDLLSDDELIKYMKYYFNGTCNGSIELLSSRELDLLARNIRSGSEIIC